MASEQPMAPSRARKAAEMLNPDRQNNQVDPDNSRTICGYCGTWRSRPCGEGCAWDITKAPTGNFIRAVNLRTDLVHACEKALNYIENTESELDIKLECGEQLRRTLTKAKFYTKL